MNITKEVKPIVSQYSFQINYSVFLSFIYLLISFTSIKESYKACSFLWKIQDYALPARMRPETGTQNLGSG